MTDNSVSSMDGSWGGHSASSSCSDFKAAVCSTGQDQWSGSSSCETTKESCGNLNTTGFQSNTNSCGSLSQSGFSTNANSCGSLSESGFSTNVSSCASLSVGGFSTNVSSCTPLSVTGFHVSLPTCGCEEETAGCDTTTTTTSSNCGTSSSSCDTSSDCSSPTLTVSGDTVSDGMYTITGSASGDGSLTITNTCTGQVTTEVWGDPHVRDGSGTDVGEFTNNNLTITLPDGTEVLMEPTAVTGGVAHIENATITNGSDAVTMNGVNGTFQDGVTLSTVFPGATAQQAIYANGATDLSMTSTGNLYVDNSSGKSTEQVVATNGTAMDLDGLTSEAA